MTVASIVAVAALIVWTAVNARLARNIGKAHDQLDARSHLYDLEDADLIERRRLLDEAEAALARDLAQFKELIKAAEGYTDLAVHALQQKAGGLEAERAKRLEVPGQ